MDDERYAQVDFRLIQRHRCRWGPLGGRPAVQLPQHGQAQRPSGHDPSAWADFCERTLDSAIETLILGSQLARGEIAHPFPEVIQSVHDPVQVEFPVGFRLKQTKRGCSFEGPVGRPVIGQVFPHPGDNRPAFLFAQANLPVFGRRTQVDQNSVGLEETVQLPQGMDHALLGHASEGPRQDRYVEQLLAPAQPLHASDLISDAGPVSLRECFPGATNEGGVGIDRQD